MVWQLIYIAAGAAMVLSFFRGRNPVWGGATMGLFIGIVVAFFQDHFWLTVLRAVAIGALTGIGADLLGMLGDRLRK